LPAEAQRDGAEGAGPTPAPGLVQFEHYTVALLVTNPDAPAFDDETAAALQDAHLSFLADLHEAGHLLAVGPVRDPAGELRGLSILNVDAERARELKEADPAVQAGAFRIRVMPWTVPAGALHFTPTRIPRSIAEVSG
jgi:uncharacterized protein